MSFGRTPCKIDDSVTSTEAYEQTLGPVPDGYHAVACCGTLHCVRHVTIRRDGPGRFDLPEAPEEQPLNSGNDHWTDERRLAFATAAFQNGRSSFKSDCTTWADYCLDYCTSPYTTRNEKKAFCKRHRINRGLPCLCGYVHKKYDPAVECRVFNDPNYSLDADIKAGTCTDCGRAIVGLPEEPNAQAKASAEAAEKDHEAASYLEAAREIGKAFRVIRVLKDETFLGSWR